MVSHKHLDESGLQPLNVFVLGVPMCACRASWILVLVLSRGINIMEFVLIRRRILYKEEKVTKLYLSVAFRGYAKQPNSFAK